MPDPRHALGQRAEAAVAAWLETRGWTILARRWRCPEGELDLVAHDPDGVLVGIEVKVRRTGRAGDPLESINRHRLLRLRKALGRFRSEASRPTGGDLVHIVARGQTLTGIARQYGSTIAAIVQANGIANPSFLRVGQRLTIPGVTPPPAAAGASASIATLTATRGEIGAIIRAEAQSQGVPVAFALAVAWHESGWRPAVISRAGAVGVMQLTPATADWVAGTMLGHRVDLYDASSNVQAGVALLRHYLDRYQGDRILVLAAYYQGQTAADRHGVYGVTRPYIASILALEKVFGS